MSPDYLALTGVRAGYGDTVVLEDINLSLARGEGISIIGRNGVGKSSLLATIAGHTRLHTGTMALAGRDITRLKPYRRARAGIGYVPQEREVFPSLTVMENLAVAARPGAWDTEAVLKMFPGLAERSRSRAGQLSGGEQQMLAVGRALMGNPQVLLMDEPSEGLAPVVVSQLTDSILRLRDETSMTILLVEQHVEMALEFATRCLVMERGRIVYDGTTSDLRRDQARMNSLVGLAGHTQA